MRMDSEMIGILLSDSMHYTIVVSLEMSDEPNIVICNSTLPPLRIYHFDTQLIGHGGIMGGIWVELREVPPVIPP